METPGLSISAGSTRANLWNLWNHVVLLPENQLPHHQRDRKVSGKAEKRASLTSERFNSSGSRSGTRAREGARAGPPKSCSSLLRSAEATTVNIISDWSLAIILRDGNKIEKPSPALVSYLFSRFLSGQDHTTSRTKPGSLSLESPGNSASCSGRALRMLRLHLVLRACSAAASEHHVTTAFT